MFLERIRNDFVIRLGLEQSKTSLFWIKSEKEGAPSWAAAESQSELIVQAFVVFSHSLLFKKLT